MAAKELINLGISPEVAKRISQVPAALSGTGTTQSGATAIGADNNGVTLTTAGGATAFVLPTAELWRPYFLFNGSATTALIFPPSGHNINNAAANASVSIAQNLGRLFMRVGSTQWISFLTA